MEFSEDLLPIEQKLALFVDYARFWPRDKSPSWIIFEKLILSVEFQDFKAFSSALVGSDFSKFES